MSFIRFIPNILSFSRIPLAFFNIHFFNQRRFLLVAILVTFSWVSDILDGAIARNFNCVTTLGKYLDKVGDTIAALSIAYMVYCFGNGMFLLPYIPLAIELILKNITYHDYDLIQFTWTNTIHAILANFSIPYLIAASYFFADITKFFPYILTISIAFGLYSALETFKEWQLGPYSRGPYKSRLFG